ncbi:uncharacterized protein [Symphalangus syndactylus]|uniref:uncharacterized protein n=1 Tax=Symphalangus syndactylus TaxID=9590 RepID=UPI003005EFE8
MQQSLRLKATCLGAERGPGSWEGELSLEPAPQGSQMERGRNLGEVGWGRSHGRCHFWDTPEWSQPRVEVMAWGEHIRWGPGQRLTWDTLAEGPRSVPRALQRLLETMAPRWIRQHKGRGRCRKAESGQAGWWGNNQGPIAWLPQWLRGGQGPMDGRQPQEPAEAGDGAVGPSRLPAGPSLTLIASSTSPASLSSPVREPSRRACGWIQGPPSRVLTDEGQRRGRLSSLWAGQVGQSQGTGRVGSQGAGRGRCTLEGQAPRGPLGASSGTGPRRTLRALGRPRASDVVTPSGNAVGARQPTLSHTRPTSGLDVLTSRRGCCLAQEGHPHCAPQASPSTSPRQPLLGGP